MTIYVGQYGSILGDGPGLSEPVGVEMLVRDSGETFSLAECREIAAALTRAADKLERIMAGGGARLIGRPHGKHGCEGRRAGVMSESSATGSTCRSSS